MKFEWDPVKNKANRLKHKISFEEAETVFEDENAVYLYDKNHSSYEQRFIVIGEDDIFRELTVCHCYRGDNDEIIRIISARKATKNEIRLYERGLQL